MIKDLKAKLGDGIQFMRICRNWYSVLPYYLIDTYIRNCKATESRKVVLKLNNGLKMVARCRGNDLGVIVDVIYRNVYNFPKKKMDIVIDVGAHIGAFSCLAALYAKKVIAVEPCPDNFSLLKQNLEMNGFSNVIPVQFALAGEKGKRRLFISEYGTANHSFISRTNRFLEVECVTLQDIFKEYKVDRVSFLKIDCEGCEYEALQSSVELLEKIDQIALEAHHGFNSKIVDLLKDSGFSVLNKGQLIYGSHEGLSCHTDER
jgi:FkbM family methyltransferase